MGYKTEFNWVLKLTPSQGFPKKLDTNKNYLFEKEGDRIYPRGIPIDIVNKDGKPFGKVIIDDVIKEAGKTRGNFRIIYRYNLVEKKVLEKIYKKTTLQYMDK